MRAMLPSLQANFGTKTVPYVHLGFAIGEHALGPGNQPAGSKFAEHCRHVVVLQDGDPCEEMANMILTPNDELQKEPLLLHCKAILHVAIVIPGSFHIMQNYGTNTSRFFTHFKTELLLGLGCSIGNVNFTLSWARHEQTNLYYNMVNDGIYASMLAGFCRDLPRLRELEVQSATLSQLFAKWLGGRGAKGRLVLMYLFIEAPLDALKYHVRDLAKDMDGYIGTLLWTLLFDIRTGNEAYMKIKAAYIVQCMAHSEYWNVLSGEFCMALRHNGEGMDPDRCLEFIQNYIKAKDKSVTNA